MQLRSQDILLVPPPTRLIDAVAREVMQDTPSALAIAEHVRRYALEAYARNIPPERMIVSLKAIVAEAAPDTGPRERAELIAHLIPIALEGYYLDPWMRRAGRPMWAAERENAIAPEL